MGYNITKENCVNVRIDVFRETVEVVRDGRYVTDDGIEVQLPLNPRIAEQTRFYSAELPMVSSPHQYETKISVVEGDCLEIAHRFVGTGEEVCVLNMASRRNPGGGVIEGSGAQEEYLFRCSDYFRSLYRFVDFGAQFGVARAAESYPLDPNFGGVFTRGITVFRSSEDTGYQLVSEPWHINAVAVAAINRPETYMVGDEERLTEPMVARTKDKIRTILRICAANRQTELVLSAFGCGAFCNPPKHMAELFKEILNADEFCGVFRKIVFAIKGGSFMKRKGNYKPFAEVLG